MCSFSGGGDATPPDAPVRFAQQKTPNRRDTRDAATRESQRRRRATGTILTTGDENVDQTQGKTLLGA